MNEKVTGKSIRELRANTRRNLRYWREDRGVYDDLAKSDLERVYRRRTKLARMIGQLPEEVK